MGLFKKIFGKSDQEADARVEQEVAQIQSGAIDKVYPILKPGNWVGLQYGALHQEFIGSGENKQLVIAYGYDAPSNLVFIMPDDMKGKEPAQIFKEAYQNLEAIPSQFEVADSQGGQVLTASGYDFASEKILCESHMRRAHELLGADELLVSIPRRTCMMITRRDADEELLGTFAYLHHHAWEDDSFGNAPIINALFVVKDGTIQGVISMDK